MEGPVTFTVIWRFLLGACSPIHIFMSDGGENAIITLKLLGATVL
jgi:hypothetical protein